jgi:hypothetical protein
MKPVDQVKAALFQSQSAVSQLRSQCEKLQSSIKDELARRNKTRKAQNKALHKWKDSVFSRLEDIEVGVIKLNSYILSKTQSASASVRFSAQDALPATARQDYIDEEQKEESEPDELDELESIISTQNEETRRYLHQLRESLKKGQNIMT